MRLSARNVIPGTVTKVKIGAVSAEVTINVAPGIDVTSIISATSVAELKIQTGAKAYAVIKSTSVMVAVDDA
jgi:molybdopterin-binding protein